jgi:hypothetical protein
LPVKVQGELSFSSQAKAMEAAKTPEMGRKRGCGEEF